MKTGNTRLPSSDLTPTLLPQWSPVMKTGNTWLVPRDTRFLVMPQWSPVMKTGNTAKYIFHLTLVFLASMEPGHEDREYRTL